ncbi:MAG: hypothetical protein PHI15_05585 [Methanomicrobium sp.]|nr:hypothetical protein [Methanomicrobium sp.]
MPDSFNRTDAAVCPICESFDCIKDAEVVISSIDTVFQKCPSCKTGILETHKPPPSEIKEPCPDCKKRFINDVIAHCYNILKENNDIKDTLPLSKTGIPLVTPGFAMRNPPFLPKRSLILITPYASSQSAKRIVDEVLEVKGVIKDKLVIPGLNTNSKNDFSRNKLKPEKNPDSELISHTNTLLAGCDVRCDIFHAGRVPFVIYKNQSMMHIEFPRGFYPKINSVGENVRRYLPHTFIDACSGAGTLGISSALFGINNVIFNDLWYPAAYWTGMNIYSNRRVLDIEKCEFYLSFDELKEKSGVKKPVCACHFSGPFTSFDVYLGDYNMLNQLGSPPLWEGTLTALDLFGKNDPDKLKDAVVSWKAKTGGDAFIP